MARDSAQNLAGQVADPRFAGLRVLIVHEWLYTWAGGERCVEQMLKVFPDATLLVGVKMPHMRDFNDIARRAEETWVGKLPGARTKHRWFLPFHALAFAMRDTTSYDLVISSSHAFEKFARASGDTKHVCYCYSPPRFLWDLYEEHLELASPAERMALRLSAPVLRALDRRAAGGVDRFVSISKYVAQRVKRSYGVESDVVYPPVEAKPVASSTGGSPQAPYLLYLGRLVEYKRIDVLIAAAERMGRRLVIAGKGPERGRLERLAGRNTEFVGALSEADAGTLLANCSAFVFAADEDFGIAPVEANAHGRPVVCLRRGGAIETMIDGETAEFFDKAEVDDVVRAIRACDARRWDANRLKLNASRFSPEAFRRGLGESVAAVLGLGAE
jgi:glycosyltransferase involved in cell wall biosynthesis